MALRVKKDFENTLEMKLKVIFVWVHSSIKICIYIPSHSTLPEIIPKGQTKCLNVIGTWVSRYKYHGSYSEIEAGFSALKRKGVNRVYFNVWADGNLYATSATAQSSGEYSSNVTFL